MLDIRKLRMLAALDRLGTLAAVARELHLTAPGVSMQLAALEREVDIALTERRGRTLVLTPAGRLLARHAESILDSLSLAELEVAALHDGTGGSYRLAAFPSIARTVVADAWARMLAGDSPGTGDSPGQSLRLELVELEPQDAMPALAAGEVDIALTHSYSNMPETRADAFAGTLIASERVWLAVRRDDPAARETVDLAAFAGHDWVIPHRRWTCHEMVRRACGAAGFTPRAVAEASDFAVQLALVAAGAGVALVPELTIATLPPQVRLCALEVPVFRHDFVLTRRGSEPDLGLARLRAVLAEAAAARLEQAIRR